MNTLFATTVLFALMTPGPIAGEGLELIGGQVITSPAVEAGIELGYDGERSAWVADALGGSGAAAVVLGDWELDNGSIARAHAWFEYGTRLGSTDAQDHLVWVQGFMDGQRREEAAALGAEIALRSEVPNS